MGFFTNTKKEKEKTGHPKLKPTPLLQPPNVHVAAGNANTNPPVPTRPKTATPVAPRSSDKDRRARRARHTQNDDASKPQLHITAAPHDRHNASHSGAQQQQQVQHYNCAPVIVNQHYYLNAPPPQHHQQDAHNGLTPYAGPSGNGFTGSLVNLTKEVTNVPSRNDGLCAWYGYSTQVLGSTINTFDEISYRLNNVLTLIDNESLAGHELDLFACRQLMSTEPETNANSKPFKEGSKDRQRGKSKDKCKVDPAAEVAASVVRGNYFSKVELYANSKLPRDLPPFAV